MSKRELKQIKEIAKNIVAGGDVPELFSKTKYGEFKFPIYSNGIDNEGLYGFAKAPRITEPAVTVAARGTIGVCFKRTEPYVPIVRLLSVFPKEGVDLTYLYYCLTTLKHEKNGSIQQQLTVPMLSDMRLYVTEDYQEQQKIAKVLSTIDDKIKLNNKINSELEAMAKELYEYWFVQFDFPDENGKPYKSSGGKMVWNEELKREIPEGWEVKKVKDICPVLTGKEDANFSTPNGEYKFFTCSQDTLRCDTPAFEGKSILIAGNGVFNVKYYNGMFNAYQRTYVLIPDDEKYVGVLYLVSKDLIDSFTKKSAGSIVKFITKGDVKGITLLDPHNDKLLNQINSIIETIAHNFEENDNLSELRDFLLPMLMNGQVTVR